MNTYRLLAGSHNEGGRTYNRGDVIESKSELDVKFGRNKFEKLVSNPKFVADTTNQADTLESMTVAQLKTLAEDEEIDLGGVTSKADILKCIRQVTNL